MNHLLSKLAIVVGLSFMYTQSHAMIVAASCLKRMGRTNKLVILHDKHRFDHNEPIKVGHMNDMRKLINTLANSNKTVPFLVEISESHTNSERWNNLVESPSNMAIKLALDNKMKYGNISFIPFDNRKEYDFWMRDMLWQTDQFTQAIKQNYQFPAHFYKITADNFFEHLDSRYHSTAELIEDLSVTQAIKQQYQDTNKQKYKDSCAILNRLLKTHDIKSKQHLFNLITRLNDSEKTELFLNLTEEHTYAVDTNLLNNVLKQSENNPLSVLLAGAYHSNTIEKRLLTQFPHFEKDMSSSMSLPDLKVNDLSRIQWPKHVPDNFMNKNMENFIHFDRTNE